MARLSWCCTWIGIFISSSSRSAACCAATANFALGESTVENQRVQRQRPRSSNKKLTHDFPHSLWVLVWLLLGKSSPVSSPPRKWTKLQPLRFLHTYSAQLPAPSSLHPSLKTEKTQQLQMGDSASYGGIHPTRLPSLEIPFPCRGTNISPSKRTFEDGDDASCQIQWVPQTNWW